MSEKALYCLGLHFKAMVEQAVNGQVPDLGKPCADCQYLPGCRANWFDMMDQLERTTGITVNLRVIHDHSERT